MSERISCGESEGMDCDENGSMDSNGGDSAQDHKKERSTSKNFSDIQTAKLNILYNSGMKGVGKQLLRLG